MKNVCLYLLRQMFKESFSLQTLEFMDLAELLQMIERILKKFCYKRWGLIIQSDCYIVLCMTYLTAFIAACKYTIKRWLNAVLINIK